MQLPQGDARLFGFDESGEWVEHLREARRADLLGSLGSFELLEEVGRGGQGVVFRARQPGTGRQIAIKRLLGGALAGPEQLRRFEREVEAAATLRHPNVVTVYGTETVDGSPLLAMEWVEGVLVTDWARALPEPGARRRVLEAFLELCAAVHHAHQRGVLHRDLKPSNVLVDAEGHPRVLDFGLAKLVRETVPSDISQSSLQLGTPAYAAPEQMLGPSRIVDSRSDVYALGAILFELLTGHRMIEGSHAEILRRLLEGLEPPRVSRLVPGIGAELDAIVAQAVAIDPERRYQSVDALAADVRRHLNGEAVLARGPAPFYVLRKLVLRHRVVAALGLTLLAVSAYYLLTLGRQQRALEEQEQRLEQTAVTARSAEERAQAKEADALAAGEQARLERQRADESKQEAEDALAYLMKDVLVATDPREVGHDPTVSEVLDAAVAKVGQRFGKNPQMEMRVRAMLAGSLEAHGRWLQAAEVRRPALDYWTEAGNDGEIGLVEIALGSDVLQIGLLEEGDARLRSGIARLEHAEPPPTESIAWALNVLGDSLSRRGLTKEAIPVLERAIELTEEDSRSYLIASLSTAYRLENDFDKACRLAEERLAWESEHNGPDTLEVARLISALTFAYKGMHDCTRSVPLLRRALAIDTRVYGASSSPVISALGRLAEALAQCQEYEEAESLLNRAIDLERDVGQPCNLPEQLQKLGILCLNLGRFEGAESALREAVDILESCYGPRSLQLIGALDALAETLIFMNQLDEAGELLDRAEALSVGRQSPSLLYMRGKLAVARGDLRAAADAYRRSAAILESIGKLHDLRELLHCLADCERGLGNEEEAALLEQRVTELDGTMPAIKFEDSETER